MRAIDAMRLTLDPSGKQGFASDVRGPMSEVWLPIFVTANLGSRLAWCRLGGVAA